MKKLLLLLMIAPMIGFGQKKVNRTDAVETTKAILTAYKAKDLETLSSLSPPGSKEFFNEFIEKGEKHPRYKSIWGWRWGVVNAWGGTIDDVKFRGIDHTTWGEVIRARVKFGADPSGREIYVVTLYFIEGKWCFDDINSPSKEMWKEE